MSVYGQPVGGAHCEDWPLRFRETREELLALFANSQVGLGHIGSTAVPGLSAKPVLDLLLGAPSLTEIESAIPALAARGYAYVPKYERELPERRYFVRNASLCCQGMRIHLHGVVEGSRIWRQQLHIRDNQRADSALRARYDALKRQLAATSADDKSACQGAKAPFIAAVMASMRVATDPDRVCERSVLRSGWSEVAYPAVVAIDLRPD